MFHKHVPIIPKDLLKLVHKVESSFLILSIDVQWDSYWDIVQPTPSHEKVAL